MEADFHCRAIGKANYACKPRTGAVKDAFVTLQRTVKTIAAKMTQGGKIVVPPDIATLKVDGDIGKITALGVQIIGEAFRRVVDIPASIQFALAGGVSGEESVRRIATQAAAINTWFNYVAANFPKAIVPDEKIVFRTEHASISPIGVVVVGAAVVGMIGFVIAAIVTQHTDGPRIIRE